MAPVAYQNQVCSLEPFTMTLRIFPNFYLKKVTLHRNFSQFLLNMCLLFKNSCEIVCILACVQTRHWGRRSFLSILCLWGTGSLAERDSHIHWKPSSPVTLLLLSILSGKSIHRKLGFLCQWWGASPGLQAWVSGILRVGAISSGRNGPQMHRSQVGFSCWVLRDRASRAPV